MRYLLESLALCIVALYIPKINLNVKEILLISLTGAFTLMIIDLYAPQVGLFMRHSFGAILGFKNISSSQIVKGGGLFDKLKNMTNDLKQEVKEKVEMTNTDNTIVEGTDFIEKAKLKYKEAEEDLINKILSGGNNNKKIVSNNNKNISNYINKLKNSI